MLRDAMLGAIEGWHPAARALVAGVDLDSIFVIPFGFPEPAPPWEPSRATLIGDAAHAMLPTLGRGRVLNHRAAAHVRRPLRQGPPQPTGRACDQDGSGVTVRHHRFCSRPRSRRLSAVSTIVVSAGRGRQPSSSRARSL